MQRTLYGQHDYEHSDRRHNEPSARKIVMPSNSRRGHDTVGLGIGRIGCILAKVVHFLPHDP
jgi:hypothetical protein